MNFRTEELQVLSSPSEFVKIRKSDEREGKKKGRGKKKKKARGGVK